MKMKRERLLLSLLTPDAFLRFSVPVALAAFLSILAHWRPRSDQ